MVLLDVRKSVISHIVAIKDELKEYSFTSIFPPVALIDDTP